MLKYVMHQLIVLTWGGCIPPHQPPQLHRHACFMSSSHSDNLGKRFHTDVDSVCCHCLHAASDPLAARPAATCLPRNLTDQMTHCCVQVSMFRNEVPYTAMRKGYHSAQLCRVTHPSVASDARVQAPGRLRIPLHEAHTNHKRG
jgi:hypothetical protein